VYWLAAIVTLLALGGGRAEARGAQQTNPEMDYFPVGKRLPKGLADFQAFGLFRKMQGGKIQMSGWVMPNRNDPDSAVPMQTVRVRGRGLFFSAKTGKGAVVTFEGKFLKSGDLTRYADSAAPVVEGRVRKQIRGKKVADGILRFTCGIGG
jgi:hypothetical protein